MQKILILQPYLDQSKTIAKFLKRYLDDCQLTGGLLEQESHCKRIPFFDEVRTIDLPSTIQSDYYDVILPTGSSSIKAVFSHVERLVIGEVSFHRDNLIGFNKMQMLQRAHEQGIPIPATFSDPSSAAAYPLFFKSAFEPSGHIRGLLHNKEDFQSLDVDEPIIFQEYINSPYTFGIGFLSDKGNILTHTMFKELISLPITGGSGVVVTRCNDAPLLKYSEKLIHSLNYSGWGLIEFKYSTKHQDYIFMELNPKFWASIEFTLLNNPRFLKELFDIQYGETDIPCLLFLNRLAEYGFRDYMKYVMKYRHCHRAYMIDSMRVLVKNMIPRPFRAMYKDWRTKSYNFD